MPLAEDTGLIVPIGQWVVKEACRVAARWRLLNPSLHPLEIAVNLSAWQLAQDDLPGLVAATLSETGLSTQHLVLELTESVLLEDSATVIGTPPP